MGTCHAFKHALHLRHVEICRLFRSVVVVHCAFVKDSNAAYAAIVPQDTHQSALWMSNASLVQVDTTAPLKTTTVEHPLYEMKAFELRVVNPFPEECDFEISLAQTCADATAEDGAGAAKASKRLGKGAEKGASGGTEVRLRLVPELVGPKINQPGVSKVCSRKIAGPASCTVLNLRGCVLT